MVDSQSTPARQRPSIVSISSYLLFLFLALQVISLIITLSTFGKTRDALRAAYEGSATDGEQVADVFAVIGIGGSIVLLLLAVVLGVLALFNNQGRNGARITTWIVGGIMVCCVGGGLLSNAAGGFNTGGGTPDGGPSPEEIQRRLEEALPSWVTPVSLLLGVLSLIALIAALVLLALPKANPFFRKQTAGWEPPTPGASYPGNPQAPGQPGYPQASGEPGYPSSGEPSYPPPPAANRPDDTPPTDRPGSTPPPTS
ncbi:hypothetical protein AB0J94_08290 [Micromonospora noduli]|uniref:hypothetical protein n=1 Tax=Micromonospora noduli TaxID=709876 RepID=UPI000DBF54F8|nr:hypothetical protein [Micromonospora noduli]KAB1926758.1 hypothetical protein F8280_09835 [Micromonospora noduli]RAO03632.1 hypothetical protein GUI43_05239 [Micromonospora noduli]RAO17326.1 hypothetical protein LUPAC07_02821 [Micromonospora noduli]RAO30556.1 hypothetical protein ONO23_04276 [Micromonospora noduli]RAO57831.1 hypothetical protein ONO86_00370 [Micromonospora noduli]